ncbi:WD40 repeat domain-containing protein [Sphaerisporangium aureirubrum]|uniref:WD40 repeat domain-containing protein n=1 Tax=Sphaerisporangium aureirubrum TaxID=1544736 RepID=A0ABW1NEG7_9ACTN
MSRRWEHVSRAAAALMLAAASAAGCGRPAEPVVLPGSDPIATGPARVEGGGPVGAAGERALAVVRRIPPEVVRLAYEIAASDDGAYVAVASWMDENSSRLTLRVFAADRAAPVLTREVTNDSGGFTDVDVADFSPGGRAMIYAEGTDGRPVRTAVFDLAGRTSRVPPAGLTRPEFSRDASRFAGVTEDPYRLAVHTVAGARESLSPPLTPLVKLDDPEAESPPAHVAVTSAGDRSVGVSALGYWKWLPRDGEITFVRCGCRATQMAIDRDARLVAFGDFSGQVSVWDTVTDREIAAWHVPGPPDGEPYERLSAEGYGPLTVLKFSLDGSRLFTVNVQGYAWDARTGRPLGRAGLSGPPSAIVELQPMAGGAALVRAVETGARSGGRLSVLSFPE